MSIATIAPAQPLLLESVTRRPGAGDNTAIAVQSLPAGTVLDAATESWTLTHTVLEGHRLAARPIAKGERILSWGLPFGLALRDIRPGEYLCNEKMLTTLRARPLGLALPAAPNFADYRLPFELQKDDFRPGKQVQSPEELSFDGFPRTGSRGVGTRNFIVVLGTSSRSAGFAEKLTGRFANVALDFPSVSGVVAVAHTEGGGSAPPNNRELVLRALAGFVVHPNCGAVLCVDFGNEPVNNRELELFLRAHGYPLDSVPHQFLSLASGWEAGLREGERVIRAWLPEVNRCTRTRQSIANLKLGLQCGGSDAFSGVSANPLLGILSREVVARGGSANLAETSELIGAESYVLANVRDLATAEKFLRATERFQEWAGWHGHSAEGNPSGGNLLRGLYNISIKSIGAARKKDPAVRLDAVIDYAERMGPPGFYFMDSPGNDLESIAGQVGAGCNLILFATGNGSITNFPFVPTIKVMTTTPRFELLRKEMDFNAGRYLDGEPLEVLGQEALGQLLAIASGAPSRGEMAGHAQVQLWREWRRTGPSASPTRQCTGIPIRKKGNTPDFLTSELQAALASPAAAPVTGLVLPTSLCSGQVALTIAANLSRKAPGGNAINRVVALPHTEGCGNSPGEAEQMFLRTLANYLAHPFVRAALLLEHGCEKTHNDAFRNVLAKLQIPAEKLGWASIQLDGGIERVTRKVMAWFEGAPAPADNPGSKIKIGFWGEALPPAVRTALDLAWDAVLAVGGSVVLTEGLAAGDDATIAYGARFAEPGLHVMACPTDHAAETLAGLGATGATLLLTWSDRTLVAGHPLIPVLQLGSGSGVPGLSPEQDLILEIDRPPRENAVRILELIARVHRGEMETRAQASGNIAFQVTRGTTGISL